ncbi:MAG: S41 family peptidase, partial [Bacteroidota bacterium]
MKKTIFLLLLSAAFSLKSWSQPDPAQSTEKFNALINYIEGLYVDTVDSKKLTEAAIVALLAELDPHSTYISAEELQEANEPLEGSFDGIGVQFNILRDTIMVVEPIPGGPSEKLGIRAGDKIVSVDGINMAGIGIKNNDVFKKLRGPRGTKVKVGIQRKGNKDLLVYEITRDKIPIYSIDASFMVDDEVGYVKVSRFAKTTPEELTKALKKLKGQGMKDLILDLQDNGGGMLSAAIDMCDEFLNGDKLVVFTQGRSFPKEEYRARPKVKGNFEEGRLVVLIDESSASASEIVSGAIQDWDRGVIVGRRSFGKGLVQRPIPLPDGSAVRLTVQKYYTPAGRCIQKPYEKGLEDYEQDYLRRLKSGEFFHADSIKFSENDKFETRLTKRT